MPFFNHQQQFAKLNVLTMQMLCSRLGSKYNQVNYRNFIFARIGIARRDCTLATECHPAGMF